MKRIFLTLLSCTTIGAATISGVGGDELPKPIEVEAVPIVRSVDVPEIPEEQDTPVQVYQQVVPEIKSMMVTDESVETEIDMDVVIEENVVSLTDEEIDLIALVTMAEAEGESELGKRLVIDTILNRVDSEIRYFPDNVHDVIYQKNAFTSMWNGRVNRCSVKEEIRQLVVEELESRTNSEVMYFCAGKYSKYGTPMFQEGNHYFSSN